MKKPPREKIEQPRSISELLLECLRNGAHATVSTGNFREFLFRETRIIPFAGNVAAS